jgi:hypothetical protein
MAPLPERGETEDVIAATNGTLIARFAFRRGCDCAIFHGIHVISYGRHSCESGNPDFSQRIGAERLMSRESVQSCIHRFIRGVSTSTTILRTMAIFAG